ncbi:phospholipid-transporting ATPase IF [Venturia canescens]|uniref:phospholipid-transporting ATPase IF n=1 Tax=Venturia canescens TaxID=32260 RepID=UPI001C9C6F3D|nr:phospholipid-transporting ATPase IF [Venturia canescens]
MGASNSALTEHRIIDVKPDNVPEESIFPRNRITSHKYTFWNFIPKNLFEQFRRIANCYFLVMAVLAFTINSPVLPSTSLLPLTFVIVVTGCKQGYEDYLRYRSDQIVNRTPVKVIRNKCLQEIHCEQIVVGDLVKVQRDEDVPCDLIILHSSESTGCCYVTTSNLDGETNLKTLFVPKAISSWPTESIVSLEGIVTCQHPLPNLYEFYGKLEIHFAGEPVTTSLTIDNVLLRGAKLKDTEYVIGTAVYTGRDTKLSLNSKMTANKFSTAEKSINKHVLFFMAILLLEVFVSTVLKEYMNSKASWDSYLGKESSHTSWRALLDALSFTILYNYIVPISLYVSVELQKFLGSLFFRWDLDMYDAKNDQPALANTSDLNEELGQVEYLFTDKTGTLTENLMIFRRCFVDGKTYMEKDCDGKIYLLPADGLEANAVRLTSWPTEIWHLMMSLSLCHSVHIAPEQLQSSVAIKRAEYRESFRQKRVTRVNSSLMMDPALPEYQAASADEKALVEASARCGVVLTKCAGDEIEVKSSDGTLNFKRLETLEFSSERKRMSVVVRDSAGDVWLYCKGADSVIFPLTSVGAVDKAIRSVSDFSKRGLRTLVIGYKKMSEPEFRRFSGTIEHARQTIGPERTARVERAYHAMEKGLTLLGVTAVEDRLQEGVQETLESLRVAGIKVWVLTGDKAETAENIAFSCGHFKRGTEVLRLMDQTTVQVCFVALTSFERRLKLEPLRQYGLMMDGPSMGIAHKNFPELLRIVATNCDSVVCCRMSPLQKCEIVQLIKNLKNRPLTAAIGDGGNDVSMIQEAHVGFGIIGKEGRQATMNADFAFSKFMYLRKALLVHGHWYYLRISTLAQYFFYKNIVFITPQLCFGFHSGFSTQAVYDSIFLMCFNLFFTSVPILCFGLLEQDYSANKLLRFPQYYKLNRRNRLFSPLQSAIWVLIGVWQTSAIYFGAYFYWLINPVILYNNTSADFWSFSTCIFHLVTLVTNVQILYRSSYWTFPLILSVILSEIVFFGTTLVYSSLKRTYDGDMLRVFHNLLISPSFWLLTFVVLITCIIPDILVNVHNAYRPMFFNSMEQRYASQDDNSINYSEASLTSESENQRRWSFIPWRGKLSLGKNT